MYLLSNKDFANKFKPALREIELIELQVYQKKGWFIFETHVCSKQDLLESKHFNKVNSITEKIGDDVENWRANNQLSLVEAKIYNNYKDNVYNKLHEVQIKIYERKDTFWESISSFFSDAIDRIMENLPTVNLPLLLVNGAIKALLPGSRQKNRELPASK